MKEAEKAIEAMLDDGDRAGKLASTMTPAKVLQQAIEMGAVSAITTEENMLTCLSATVEVIKPIINEKRLTYILFIRKRLMIWWH